MKTCFRILSPRIAGARCVIHPALVAELEEKGPSRIIVPVRAPLYETQLPIDQTVLKDPVDEDIRKRLEALTVEALTPIEAMNILYELKKLTQN